MEEFGDVTPLLCLWIANSRAILIRTLCNKHGRWKGLLPTLLY
jgi:hypothetical protein